MSLFDSLLDLFRKKPTAELKQTPNDISVPPMATYTINSVTLSPDLNTLFLIDDGRAIAFNLINKAGIVISTLNGQLTVTSALPGIPLPVDEDDDGGSADPKIPGDPTGPIDAPMARLAARRRILRLSTVSARWNFIFFADKGVLSIMGASDIDTSIMGASDIDTSLVSPSTAATTLTRESIAPSDPSPEATPGCQIYSFRITRQSINIKKAGELLLVEY